MVLFDAYLDGVSLSSLADEIIIRDIVEQNPTQDLQTYKRSLHAGTHITSAVRRTLPIDIVYCIRAYDVARRAEIADLIAGWAGKGGNLTVNTRPGKHLYVSPAELPRVGSSLKWTEDLTLTLTAYEQPYWEDVEPLTLLVPETIKADGDQYYYFEGYYEATGNVPRVPATCMLTNKSPDTPMTYIKIAFPDSNTYIELTGMEIKPNGKLWIGYDSHDLINITGQTTQSMYDSLLKYRTAESSDDLIAVSGAFAECRIYSDVPVSGSIMIRGRWL